MDYTLFNIHSVMKVLTHTCTERTFWKVLRQSSQIYYVTDTLIYWLVCTQLNEQYEQNISNSSVQLAYNPATDRNHNCAPELYDRQVLKQKGRM